MHYNEPMTTLPPVIWIDDPAALAQAAQGWAQESRLAIDTESNGLHAYQERICLIQVSTPSEDYLIDPLSIPDLAPLGALLRDESIEKVFHAAEYDLICLQRDFGYQVNNLFDTMLAARILGYPRLGLGNLLDEKFRIHLNKRYQKANWARRPLPPEMIDYARMDTRYLFPLRDRLEAELRERDRWQLAQEDFRLACRVTVPPRQPPSWQKVAKRQRLDGRQAARLQALLDWREEEARRRDRPPFKIIGNQQLLALALEPPRNSADWRRSGLSPRQLSRYRAALRAVLQQAETAPPPQRRPWQAEDPAFLARLEALSAWRKEEGLRRQAPSDVILPRSLMQRIARQEPRNAEDLRALLAETPWRFEHFGAEILRVLQSVSPPRRQP